MSESEISIWLRHWATEIDRGHARKLCVTPDGHSYAITVEQTRSSLKRLIGMPGHIVTRDGNGALIDPNARSEETTAVESMPLRRTDTAPCVPENDDGDIDFDLDILSEDELDLLILDEWRES